MSYRDRASISTNMTIKQRLRRLIGTVYGLTENAVLDRMITQAETAIDISKGMPPESCSSQANDRRKPRQKPCQDTASEST